MKFVKNILLIDWHLHHRRALELLVRQEPSTNLVASLEDPLAVSPQNLYMHSVDLILLGNIPPQSCPDLLDWIHYLGQYWVGTKFLILGTPGRHDRVRLLPSGNIWWLSRQASAKRIRDKILEISEPSTQNLPHATYTNPELTSLELEVWRAKLKHKEEYKIIEQLAIRESTYHAIVRNLSDKLQTYTQLGLQRKAISMGLE